MSDHKGIRGAIAQRGLSSYVQVDSFQPAGRGAYHVRLTKKKKAKFTGAVPSCACNTNQSNRYYGPSIQTSGAQCDLNKYHSAHKDSAADRALLQKLLQHRALFSKTTDAVTIGSATAMESVAESSSSSSTSKSSSKDLPPMVDAGDVIDLTFD